MKQNFGVEHFIRGVREILGRATERLAGARGKFFFRGPYLKNFSKNFFGEQPPPHTQKRLAPNKKISGFPTHRGPGKFAPPAPPFGGPDSRTPLPPVNLPMMLLEIIGQVRGCGHYAFSLKG
jgi:hypothetical protein